MADVATALVVAFSLITAAIFVGYLLHKRAYGGSIGVSEFFHRLTAGLVAMTALIVVGAVCVGFIGCFTVMMDGLKLAGSGSGEVEVPSDVQPVSKTPTQSIPAPKQEIQSEPQSTAAPKQESQSKPPPVSLDMAEIHYAKLERQAVDNGWQLLGIERTTYHPGDRNGWVLMPTNMALMEDGNIRLVAKPVGDYIFSNNQGTQLDHRMLRSNSLGPGNIPSEIDILWLACQPNTVQEMQSFGKQPLRILVTAETPEDLKAVWLRLERRFEQAETTAVCSLPGTISEGILPYDVHVSVVPPMEKHTRFIVNASVDPPENKGWGRMPKTKPPRFPERHRRQFPAALTITTDGIEHSITMPFFSKTVTSDELWQGLRTEFVRAGKEAKWDGNGELSIECQMPSTVHVVIRSRWPDEEEND